MRSLPRRRRWEMQPASLSASLDRVVGLRLVDESEPLVRGHERTHLRQTLNTHSGGSRPPTGENKETPGSVPIEPYL